MPLGICYLLGNNNQTIIVKTLVATLSMYTSRHQLAYPKNIDDRLCMFTTLTDNP